MPSSSARCSQLPRSIDKVPYYVALKKFRDYLNGNYPELKEEEIIFPSVLINVSKNKKQSAEEAVEVKIEENSTTEMKGRLDLAIKSEVKSEVIEEP